MLKNQNIQENIAPKMPFTFVDGHILYKVVVWQIKCALSSFIIAFIRNTWHNGKKTKHITRRTIQLVGYTMADIWVTFGEELAMCGIRADKQRWQSSFRQSEPEMSARALGDWMVIKALLIFTDWRLTPLEDFSITRALEAVFLSAAAADKETPPPTPHHPEMRYEL